MDQRGKQLRVPLYALEDYTEGKDVEIGDFGYDGETAGESTDAMFDDGGEFADVAGSVTELTNRGYKLARRIVSAGGSVRDILEGLNSLYIKPPDIRSANPTVGSYAFSNIMVLLEKDGLIRTERGMPVQIIYRPPASRQVFVQANPDDATMVGLGGLGQYRGYSNDELLKSVVGLRTQAASEAAKRRALLADPGQREKLVQLATKTAVRVSSTGGGGPAELGWDWWNPLEAVKSVATSAYDAATDVVLGRPVGESAGLRDNLEYLEAETERRIESGQLVGVEAQQMTAMLEDTKQVFDKPFETFVDETAKGVVEGSANLAKGPLKILAWAKDNAAWIAGGAALAILGPPLLQYGTARQKVKARI